MATLTDPLATSLYSWEAKKLGGWIDDAYEKIFDKEAPAPSTSNGNPNATTTASATNASSNSGTQPKTPAETTPKGGGKPQ
jgi:hypothetical protein